MTIGFVTSEKLPKLTPGDQLLVEAFKTQGIPVIPVIWTNPEATWDQFQCLIIRSCWDYHRRITEFKTWLDHLEKLGVTVYNPIDIIRENSSKIYLKELQRIGFQIIDSEWFAFGEQPKLRELMEKNHWPDVIIKPNVGATAFQTVKVHIKEADDFRWELLDFPHGFMVQEYKPEITTHGEWSHIFFNKTYSHSVLKTVKSGEFRVQSDFGGSRVHGQAEPYAIAAAQRIVDHYQCELLYARIDGIQIGHEFYLMEVELIEPELFIDNLTTAAQFVAAYRAIQANNAL